MAVVSDRRSRPTGLIGRLIRGHSESTGRDRIVGVSLAIAAIIPTGVLVFLAYEMVRTAWPAIWFNGWQFFTTTTFTMGNLYATGSPQVHNGYEAPPGAHYGVLPLLFGTGVSSGLALLFALPVAVGGALMLAEKVPARLQGPLGIFLELLAGIPSVIFGLWGIYALGPFLSRTLYPAIASLHIPWLSGPVGAGQGLLTGGLVLSVMIIPIIASITRELIRSVSPVTREAAHALGLTPFEGVRVVVFPFIRTGVMAAAVLGLARALGETIAVLIISGNALNILPRNIFSPFTTMASTIAALLDGALTDFTGMAVSSLAEVGLVLIVLTLVTNVGGRWIARRLGGVALPVGRGV